MNNDNKPARYKPITDLSSGAVIIGRTIDRLAPGRYLMEFEKPAIKNEDWRANIFSIEIVIEDD